MKTAAILSPTDPVEKFVEFFWPLSQGLRMQQLVLSSSELTLRLSSSSSEARCPLCGQLSRRVHSRYSRALQDLPWGPLRVRIHLSVHRFFCQNPQCARKMFTEPLADQAERSARRTDRLRDALL